jgi:hypothetical protein
LGRAGLPFTKPRSWIDACICSEGDVRMFDTKVAIVVLDDLAVWRT